MRETQISCPKTLDSRNCEKYTPGNSLLVCRANGSFQTRSWPVEFRTQPKR
jgi:hypothetical protein